MLAKLAAPEAVASMLYAFTYVQLPRIFGRPNSGGTFRANRCVFDAQGFDAIQVETYGSTRPSSESGAGDLLLTIDLSRSCSLYQTGLNEVRVNAIFCQSLIRAF